MAASGGKTKADGTTSCDRLLSARSCSFVFHADVREEKQTVNRNVYFSPRSGISSAVTHTGFTTLSKWVHFTAPYVGKQHSAGRDTYLEKATKADSEWFFSNS